MTLYVHHLTGCAPAPLAHYLKALGVLRIVGEQKDRAARGWWQDEHFCLMSSLDRAGLERFFLEEYAPTPIFNPWGARSGFYPGSSERAARLALERIEASSDARLATLRAAAAAVRAAIQEVGGSKPDTDENEMLLIDKLKARVRGAGADWLSTVVAEIDESYRKPALVGTGGNEGSGSYTSAYLSAVVACVIGRSCDHSLGLFLPPRGVGTGGLLAYEWDGSFGQFLPGGVASAWDLLLMLEGSTLFRSAVAVRSDMAQSSGTRFLASPFYFAPWAAGAGSSGVLDEFALNKGRRNPGRGEQWFPLWTTPARLPELEAIIATGRCAVSRRGARKSLDAARAVGRLGVTRGIVAFSRYGYLQRNNQATHFAVPLGRVDVSPRAASRLIDDIAPWLDRLHRAARKDHAPARLVLAEARLANSVFAALTHDDPPARWQDVLLAAGNVEMLQARGTAFEIDPIPALAPDWLAAADDGSAEWRLACALGSAAASYDWERAADPIRRHWLPLESGGRRFRVSERRLARDPAVVMFGRDPIADLIALVERRLVESIQRGERRLPLVAAFEREAQPSDLARVIEGRVDLARTVALARSLMAVRWSHVVPAQPATEPQGDWPDEGWMAIRLACLPWSLDEGRHIWTDSAMLRRLGAGNAAAAVAVALRRLTAAGLRPPIQSGFADPVTARLWLAALAFPISYSSARIMAQRFETPHSKEMR